MAPRPGLPGALPGPVPRPGSHVLPAAGTGVARPAGGATAARPAPAAHVAWAPRALTPDPRPAPGEPDARPGFPPPGPSQPRALDPPTPAGAGRHRSKAVPGGCAPQQQWSASRSSGSLYPPARIHHPGVVRVGPRAALHRCLCSRKSSSAHTSLPGRGAGPPPAPEARPTAFCPSFAQERAAPRPTTVQGLLPTQSCQRAVGLVTFPASCWFGVSVYLQLNCSHLKSETPGCLYLCAARHGAVEAGTKCSWWPELPMHSSWSCHILTHLLLLSSGMV